MSPYSTVYHQKDTYFQFGSACFFTIFAIVITFECLKLQRGSCKSIWTSIAFNLCYLVVYCFD